MQNDAAVLHIEFLHAATSLFYRYQINTIQKSSGDIHDRNSNAYAITEITEFLRRTEC